jgi:uncharacterized protein (TIGR02448 family)
LPVARPAPRRRVHRLLPAVPPKARDDAASFVASEGRIRGARLEAALRQLRERDAAARRASDLELAQAILAL